ncbi:MAG: amino acid ABC transporter permease [Chloroflexi bacterium]|nr:amino acid ABC transporter permease [Chloroflexota bacterium]|tara:strand:+ start:1079 stop:2308 length:1230 start_codon:yes stop_codon:yes gene_type:complete
MSAPVAIIYNSLRLYKELNSKNNFSDKLLFIRYDRSIRKLVLQIIFSTFILLFFWYLASRALNLELGYGHLTSRAGFGISHSFLSDYTSNQSRWDAYIVGVINTIRVSLVGIALATLLGVLMGIARLSKNFLVRSIATGYVEFLRNTPLLIQIIFWQLVFLQFPQISKAWTFGGFSLWSNRGILLPLIKSDENGSLWAFILLVSFVLVLILRSYLNKYKEEKVNFISPNLISTSIFAAILMATYFLLNIQLSLDIPKLEINKYGTYIPSGGFTLTPEFSAILVALVMYTGTFITEIVRGSIQSLPKGQTEAAQALGFSSYQRITLIILPQALRSIIPPLTNQYLNLTKNSSLSVAIAYPDVFMVSRTIMNNAGYALPMLFLILITFLTLSLIISLVMNLLNSRVTRMGA